MTYTEEIVRALVETLSRTAGLPTFQLAGHVPNLGFWMGEARHAVGVLSGYGGRFATMLGAQERFDQEHPDDVQSRGRHEYDYHAPRLALNAAACDRLTREVLRAADRLVDRCLSEGLLDIVAADELRGAARGGQ